MRFTSNSRILCKLKRLFGQVNESLTALKLGRISMPNYLINVFHMLQERRKDYDLENLSVYFQIYPQAVLDRPAQQLCIFCLLKPRDSASTSEKVSSNSPSIEYCSTIREGLGFLFLYRSVYIGL